MIIITPNESNNNHLDLKYIKYLNHLMISCFIGLPQRNNNMV